MNGRKLFSVAKSDCVFKYYKGSGKGGQKKNKTENCCQCTHIASGAQAYSEEGRSKDFNMRNAFCKMSRTKTFKAWAIMESARITGVLAMVEEIVDEQMKYVRIETKEDGVWVETKKP